MKPFTVKDIIEICNGQLLYGNDKEICENYSKDTRDIKENDVYIGINGDKFNGNSFYKDAFNKGASVCILDLNYKNQIEFIKNKTVILVDDTIKAIQTLGSYRRSLYNIPVIAITGSVGKTSTKDMIHSVLSTKYKTLKTEGNFNNEIGLPLTLLKLKDHEALVLEMGMDDLGQISFLSKLAKPTLAVITNVGTAHIEFLKSRENILKAKLEIIDGLSGQLVINNDNDLLNTIDKTKINVITCGIKNKSNIMAKNIIITENKAKYYVNNEQFSLNVPTKAFVYNSLLAYAIGAELKISIDNIKKGLENFNLTKDRMDIIKNRFIIINDTYNANYDSMKNAIEYLTTVSSNKKIAILGDMLELGDYSQELHEKVGLEVKKAGIDYLITIGKDSKFISDKAIKLGMNDVYHFNNKEDSYNLLKQIISDNDAVLVKASNSIKLIDVVEYLKSL